AGPRHQLADQLLVDHRGPSRWRGTVGLGPRTLCHRCLLVISGVAPLFLQSPEVARHRREYRVSDSRDRGHRPPIALVMSLIRRWRCCECKSPDGAKPGSPTVRTATGLASAG